MFCNLPKPNTLPSRQKFYVLIRAHQNNPPFKATSFLLLTFRYKITYTIIKTRIKNEEKGIKMDAYLKINFAAKPCRNLRMFYEHVTHNPAEGLLSGVSIEKCYIADIEHLSDLPNNVSPYALRIEWETGDDVKVDHKKLIRAVDEQLHIERQDLSKIRGKVNLKPLLEFFETYGMFFEDPMARETDFKSITAHLYSLMLIRNILRQKSNPRRLLEKLYDAICSDQQHDKTSENLYIIASRHHGFVLGAIPKTTSLVFRIPITYKETVKWVFDGLKEDPDDKEPLDDFINEMRQFALESVMQYLSNAKLKYSVVLEGGPPLFESTIHSPTVFYLLSIKPCSFNKQEYDNRYSKRPYARASDYFRKQFKAAHITRTQYDYCRKRAKKLIKEDQLPYHKAVDTIKEELRGEN
jgi:hypothetical protein